MITIVYTDGACLNNPGGPGGWGWAVPNGAYASGADPETTNQRMELTAVLQAVQANPGIVRVVCDSTYVVNCFKQRWYEKWERNDWMGSGRKPIANQDLWRPLITTYHERSDQLSFEWVKGHSDDPMNDVADRLATEAARTQTARSGAHPPTALGEPDQPHLATRSPGPLSAFPAGVSSSSDRAHQDSAATSQAVRSPWKCCASSPRWWSACTPSTPTSSC